MLCLKYLKFLNLKKIFEGGGADTCPNKIAFQKHKSKLIEPLFKYYVSKLWKYFEAD